MAVEREDREVGVGTGEGNVSRLEAQRHVGALKLKRARGECLSEEDQPFQEMTDGDSNWMVDEEHDFFDLLNVPENRPKLPNMYHSKRQNLRNRLTLTQKERRWLQLHRGWAAEALRSLPRSKRQASQVE
jgi:hypothetical protein